MDETSDSHHASASADKRFDKLLEMCREPGSNKLSVKIERSLILFWINFSFLRILFFNFYYSISISELEIKLEQARRTNRLLSNQIGTTIVSSSSSSDADDFVTDYDDNRKSYYETEQQDFEFGAIYTYKTNVSCQNVCDINFKKIIAKI